MNNITNQDIIQILGIILPVTISLLALFLSWQSNRIAKATSQKMRDSDYAALSDSYAALLKLRNLLQNNLPVAHLAQQHLYQLSLAATDALRNVPVARRIMGQVWTDELVAQVAEAAIVANKLSGMDLEKLKEEIAEGKPTILDLMTKKTEVTKRLDKLLVELDDKMKRF